MIGQTLGRYHLDEEIGAGGMGVVYRATDTRLERSVAVKILPPDKSSDRDSRRRMRREALTLSRLSHPNVQVVHDFDSSDDGDYIVSELIDGLSLADRLQEAPLAEEETLDLGLQLARGIAAAHAAGIVHRDIAPTNVRVTPEGNLKILDFGLARSRRLPSPKARTETVELEGQVSGTVPYMAPEQLRGEPPTPAVDVYAAGALLYEMATGARPFPQQQFAGLVDAILNRAPVPPRELNPTISGELEALILRTLSKDPGERPSDGAALVDALRRRSRPVIAGLRQRGSRLSAWSAAAVGTALMAMISLAAGLGSGTGSTCHGAAPKAPEVAVLPLGVYGSADGSSALAGELTDALITDLAGFGGLGVVSRTSTALFGDTALSLPVVAERLGVDFVVEGSIQIVGSEVVLSVRLVDGCADRSIWAARYRLAVEDDVAERLAMTYRVADEIRSALVAAGALEPAPA